MRTRKTERGFDIIEFKDLYGVKCNLQNSSLASKDAIWLGVDSSRMHLSKDQVKEMLPHLVKFIETGELNRDEP